MNTRYFAVSAAAVFFVIALLMAAEPAPGTKPGDRPRPTPGGPGKGGPDVPDLEPVPDPLVVTDVFSVSQVGRPNAKESRETLLAIFEKVAAQHAIDVAAKKGEVMAKAETFRILERASGPEAEGANLCLCEHGGEICIVSFPAGAFPRGETTPPMAAEKMGLRPYRVKAKRPFAEGAPDPGAVTDSAAAFFGAMGVGVKAGLDFELEPILVENPPDATDPGPVVSEEFGRKFETFTADLTLPKWTAELPTVNEVSEELTREDFVKGLKNGKTYEFKTEEVRKCPKCIGFGRISDDRPDFRERDGKRKCPQCLAQKELLHKVTYEVKW